MLYLSIAVVICFALWCKYKPEITINHTYLQKLPVDMNGKETQTYEEIEKQNTDKDKKEAAQAMDQAIGVINSIMNGGDEDGK